MAKEKKPKTETEPPVDGEEGEAAPAKKKLPILIIAIAAGVLVLGGGGAGAFFLMKPKPAAEGEAHKPEKKKETKKADKGGHGGGAAADPKTLPVVTAGPDGVTYVTLPDILSNMQTQSGKTSYLKLKLTLECTDDESVHAIESNMPRVDDVLQGFLRELRPEDLTGSQGSFQLRLEILRRINLVLSPHKVKAVLIEEMLIT
ncbi:MAG: flagellar basal body-associated FliL family protein [Asticcacaulis sp.]